MSNLAFSEGLDLFHRPEIRLEFACLPDGGIGAFDRGDPEWEEPEDRRPIYVLRDEGWRADTHSKLILVSMLDVCPYADLQPHEYRKWNEHVLLKFIRNLKGEGVLTIVHRQGWGWHFGMSWSRYPLQPRSREVSQRPPAWWTAEDRWCELEEDFEDFRIRVEQRNEQRILAWEHRQTRYQLLVDRGYIEPPRLWTPADRRAFQRRLVEVFRPLELP